MGNEPTPMGSSVISSACRRQTQEAIDAYEFQERTNWRAKYNDLIRALQGKPSHDRKKSQVQRIVNSGQQKMLLGLMNLFKINSDHKYCHPRYSAKINKDGWLEISRAALCKAIDCSRDQWIRFSRQLQEAGVLGRRVPYNTKTKTRRLFIRINWERMLEILATIPGASGHKTMPEIVVENEKLTARPHCSSPPTISSTESEHLPSSDSAVPVSGSSAIEKKTHPAEPEGSRSLRAWRVPPILAKVFGTLKPVFPEPATSTDLYYLSRWTKSYRWETRLTVDKLKTMMTCWSNGYQEQPSSLANFAKYWPTLWVKYLKDKKETLSGDYECYARSIEMDRFRRTMDCFKSRISKHLLQTDKPLEVALAQFPWYNESEPDYDLARFWLAHERGLDVAFLRKQFGSALKKFFNDCPIHYVLLRRMGLPVDRWCGHNIFSDRHRQLCAAAQEDLDSIVAGGMICHYWNKTDYAIPAQIGS